MKSDTTLDYALFQLSPKRSRCELFVSGDGKTEKLASGLLKPFLTHLTVAENQVAREVPSIKLEVNKHKNDGSWFTKGTLERFVRFVSTPEVLELVIRIDGEMSQLEAARKIYLQGAGDQISNAIGGDVTGASTSPDITKKELLRAIDVRLVAVRQDLTTACSRASAAGFTIDTISDLQLFADRFGAHRLSEACAKFIALSKKRPDLISTWKVQGDNQAVRSSFESDMSIDEPNEETIPVRAECHQQTEQQKSQDQDTSRDQVSTEERASSSITFPGQHSLREASCKRDEGKDTDQPVVEKEPPALSESPQMTRAARRLSVQDRINLFENKQKEQTTSSGSKVVTGKPTELRRLSSDMSSSSQSVEKAVLRRWSGASDMSMDLSSEKKDSESSASTPCSTSNSLIQTIIYPSALVGKDNKVLKDTATSSMTMFRVSREEKDTESSSATPDSALKFSNQTSTYPSASVVKDSTVLKDTATSSVTKFRGSGDDSHLKDQSVSLTNVDPFSGKEEANELRNQIGSGMQSRAFSGRSEGVGSKDLKNSEKELGAYDSLDGVGSRDQPVSQPIFKASSVRPGDGRLKSQVPVETHIQSKTSIDRSKVGLMDQAGSPYQSFNRTLDVTESDSTKNHTKFAPSAQEENVELIVRTASEVNLKSSISKVNDVGSADETSKVPSTSFSGIMENARHKHQPANFSQLRESPRTNLNVGVNSKERSVLTRQSRDFTRNTISDFQTKDPAAYHEKRDSEDDVLVPQPRWSSFPGKSEGIEKKDLMFSQMPSGGLSSRVEDSSRQEMKSQRKGSSEQSHNLPGKRGESASTLVNSGPLASRGKVVATPEVFDCPSITVVEQVQKGRQSKGNQELNEELQIKANDLEKLFAAHKLRVPGDQSAVRRSKPAEVHVEQVENAVLKKPVEVTPPQFPRKFPPRETPGISSDVSEYDPNLLTMIVDNQDQDYPEKSRGKFYDTYVQKRDAKLKEEWSSNRGQKEAKMKAMHDYLESSSAEMKVKFSGSFDRQNSALTAQRRAEKMRSFNNRSAMKIREQHPIGFLRSEEDEDLAEIHEHNQYTEDKVFGGTVLGDGSSRSVLSKRIGINKTTLSSASRTSAALLSRSSAKPFNSSSERRRVQPENPLAQSVPNFSDLRKENTKPASGVSKVTTRSQSRSVRSKSISEELPLVKEEKPRRPQLLRKNSTGTSEMDPSSLKSELTQLKFDKEQTEQSLNNKVMKNGEMKSFLRKGNGIHPGAGAVFAKLKASVPSEKLKSEEDDDDSEEQFEDSVDMIQDEEESGAVMHDELKTVDYAGDSDYEKAGVSNKSVKSGDPELENEELMRSLGPIHPDSVDEVAAAVPSIFHTSVDPVQDSPGESPASWNSRGHHPFFYAQEASDMDAYVESPMGSPASWNSHSLTQMEADAARMRKKWGSAQKTILLSNTSNNQTRKDVSKGFKRLLKFGRKSRGTESLVDWISATTSEGDDDTEDGCDLANRSSEDLRKSRMGFSQDGFNDGELFNEQVHALRSSIPTPPANFKLREEHLSGSSLKAPRSFFSLSSFRSKGSESKPR